MFTIIGADGKEYGPVSADQVKDWIVAGRANGQTKIKREGTTEWKSLAEFPELAVLLGATPPPAAAAPMAKVDPKIYAADLLARAPKLVIGDAIGRGWNLLKANFWPLVGVTALVYIVSSVVGAIPLVGLLLWGVFVGGLFNYYLKRLRGQPADLGDAFGGFSLAFVQLMLGGLVVWVLTLVGFACLVLPGIYLAVAWSFTMPLIVDKKLEFWTAMEVGRRVVTAQWWRVLGLLILTWLIAVVGLVGCGIGFFVTLPISVGAIASAYEAIFNPPPKAA